MADMSEGYTLIPPLGFENGNDVYKRQGKRNRRTSFESQRNRMQIPTLYDDVPAAAWPAFNLTTVRQPVNRMVAETVDILLQKIADTSTQPRKVKIDGPLIVRGSARVPKGWRR